MRQHANAPGQTLLGRQLCAREAEDGEKGTKSSWLLRDDVPGIRGRYSPPAGQDTACMSYAQGQSLTQEASVDRNGDDKKQGSRLDFACV